MFVALTKLSHYITTKWENLGRASLSTGIAHRIRRDSVVSGTRTDERASRTHLHIWRSRCDTTHFVISFVISPWYLSSLKAVHSAAAAAAMCLARSNRTKTNLTLSLIDTWSMTHNDTETAEGTRSGREYARGPNGIPSNTTINHLTKTILVNGRAFIPSDVLCRRKSFLTRSRAFLTVHSARFVYGERRLIGPLNSALLLRSVWPLKRNEGPFLWHFFF